MPRGLTAAERNVVKRKLERLIAPPLTCPRCEKQFKMEADDINREYCYDCMPRGIDKAESHRRAKFFAKEKAVLYKGGKCIECGYDKHLMALEFHHRNPVEKEFDPSNKLNSINQFEKFKDEFDKCDLLCANCHKVKHFNEEFKIKLYK